MSDKKRDKDLAYCKMFGCDFKEIFIDKAIDKLHCDYRLVDHKYVLVCPRCYLTTAATFYEYCYECNSIVVEYFYLKSRGVPLFEHANDNDRLKKLFEIIQNYRSMSNKY